MYPQRAQTWHLADWLAQSKPKKEAAAVFSWAARLWNDWALQTKQRSGLPLISTGADSLDVM